jgi:hypothetical protein
MSYGLLFFFSLLFTISIEIVVLLFVIKKIFKIEVKTKEIFYWGLFVNLFSLPYLWFVFPFFISPDNYVLIGEILIILIESLILLKVLRIKFKKVVFLSIIANITSYLVGLMIFR